MYRRSGRCAQASRIWTCPRYAPKTTRTPGTCRALRPPVPPHTAGSLSAGGLYVNGSAGSPGTCQCSARAHGQRSEEHTSELQSLAYLVCRLLLEKKKKSITRTVYDPTYSSEVCDTKRRSE